MQLTRSVLSVMSRNSAMFYWQLAILIGPLTVLYSPVENDRAHLALLDVIFLDFSIYKYIIEGFGL